MVVVFAVFAICAVFAVFAKSRRSLALIALIALTALIAPAALTAQTAHLNSTERRLAQHVDNHHTEAVALLERIVNINSGSLNREGVRRVAEVLLPEFRALGFEARYAPLPDSLARGGHLIAERKGSRGKRVLLIGHLDTVFEEDSPFQLFSRIAADTVAGPGVADMKGGDVAILYALKALHAAGELKNTTITVILTADEERVGRPVDVARKDLIDAAQRSDIALGFEGGSRDPQGDLAVVARRSSSRWTLRVKGTAAHSSGVFGRNTGAGAIFEAGRILNAFYEQLREENLTFNAALIVGGTEAVVREDATASASGKTNIVPAHAEVQGDLRALTDEQLERARVGMRGIVAQNLPRTSAQIEFDEGYPPMPPTPGNYEVLRIFSEVSQALGFGAVRPFDPGSRGAGDISFAAPYVSGIDGLGPGGPGSHTVNERLDLRNLTKATKRAAVLIYRLTR